MITRLIDRGVTSRGRSREGLREVERWSLVTMGRNLGREEVGGAGGDREVVPGAWVVELEVDGS